MSVVAHDSCIKNTVTVISFAKENVNSWRKKKANFCQIRRTTMLKSVWLPS